MWNYVEVFVTCIMCETWQACESLDIVCIHRHKLSSTYLWFFGRDILWKTGMTIWMPAWIWITARVYFTCLKNTVSKHTLCLQTILPQHLKWIAVCVCAENTVSPFIGYIFNSEPQWLEMKDSQRHTSRASNLGKVCARDSPCWPRNDKIDPIHMSEYIFHFMPFISSFFLILSMCFYHIRCIIWVQPTFMHKWYLIKGRFPQQQENYSRLRGLFRGKFVVERYEHYLFDF